MTKFDAAWGSVDLKVLVSTLAYHPAKAQSTASVNPQSTQPNQPHHLQIK